MSPARFAAVLVALSWLAHWTASALPPVHVGSVDASGFTVAAVAGSLALFAAVMWFMVLRPMVMPPRYVRGVRV